MGFLPPKLKYATLDISAAKEGNGMEPVAGRRQWDAGAGGG